MIFASQRPRKLAALVGENFQLMPFDAKKFETSSLDTNLRNCFSSVEALTKIVALSQKMFLIFPQQRKNLFRVTITASDVKSEINPSVQL